MPFVSRNDGVSVGVAETDAQHRRMSGLIDALHEALSGGGDREVPDRAFAEAMTYARTRFASEEALMRSTAIRDAPPGGTLTLDGGAPAPAILQARRLVSVVNTYGFSMRSAFAKTFPGGIDLLRAIVYNI